MLVYQRVCHSSIPDWFEKPWVIELSKIVELSSSQERFGAKGVQILPYFVEFPYDIIYILSISIYIYPLVF